MNSNPQLMRATTQSAGYDLQSTDDMVVLVPGQRRLFPTGVTYNIKPGYVAIIKPRSGMAVKYGIDVLAGVCDADYQGEIKVCLINHGDEPIYINKGDRIAQLILVEHGVFANELRSHTTRADGGFGSTDMPNL
jgi:dUTP pyrophosphatase